MIEALELKDLLAPMTTVFAALVVLVGGSVAYWNQKRIDRRELLIARRREIYADLLVAISRSVATRDAQANIAYQKAKSEIFVFGSDDVVSKMKPLADLLEEHSDVSSSTGGELLFTYAALVYAMRADSYENSELTIEQLSKLTPYTPTDGSKP